MSGGRKWTMAKWGAGLGTAICAAAIAGWIYDKPGAAGILGQGVGLVSLVLGMYSAANVAQKKGRSKNNSNSLVDQDGGKNE